MLIAAVSAVFGDVAVSARSIIADAVQAEDVEVSRFGTYLAFYDASEGNTIRVFDATGTELWRRRIPFYWAGSLDPGSVIQFTPDESRILFPGGRNSNDVAICDSATGELLDVVRGHENDVGVIALSEDGRHLFTASYNENALWESTGDGFELLAMRPFEPSVKAAEFLPDGERLVISQTIRQTRSIVVFDVSSGAFDQQDGFSIQDNNISHDIYQIAISPDGSLVAGGYRDRIVVLSITSDELELVDTIENIPSGNTYAVVFAADSRTLLSGHYRFVHVWNHERSKWTEGPVVATQQPAVNDMELSADGSTLYLATTADENSIALYDVTGLPVSPIGRIADSFPGAIPPAVRAAITPGTATRLVGAIDEALFAPRDMFETADEYDRRIASVRSRLLGLLYDEVELLQGVELLPNPAATHDILVHLDGEGAYDVDAARYTISALGATATLEIDRNAARDLFRNWEAARVRATRFERDGIPDYADFRLMHPTNQSEYPVRFAHNPMTGERMNMAGRTIAAITVGPHLALRNLQLLGIFPALYQSYESAEPFGTMTVANTGTGIVSDVSIVVSIPGVTASSRRVDVPSSISSGQEHRVSLYAPVLASVLGSDQGEPATLELAVSYRRGASLVEETIQRQIRVLNRNAIQWQDDTRVGSFVTVTDDQVIDWAGSVAASIPVQPTSALTRNILYAMQLFESLGVAGLQYVVDPNSAYESLSEDTAAVDFLRFPRETLATGAGDCDDLSVLTAALLEAVGISTAFITTPGHIFMAFDTGIEANDAGRRFVERTSVVIRDGRVWMPVETTLLREGFTRAWQVGALEWRQAQEDGTAQWFATADAWRSHPPVSPPLDTRARFPDPQEVARVVQDELDGYRELEMAPRIAKIREEATGKPASATQNQIGIVYATYGLVDEAARAFEAAAADEEFVPALINLANVLSIVGDHEAARTVLERARAVEPENARILLGLAFSYWESGAQSEARDTYSAASSASPSLARRFPLFDTADDGARASDRTTAPIFREDWAEE
jgi:hypothetical protein